MLGLPGGINNPYFSDVEALAKTKGLTLKEGSGGDPDTLYKKLVWVMDTEKFPFKQGEVYHQFHG